jgi:hypothetical protein
MMIFLAAAMVVIGGFGAMLNIYLIVSKERSRRDLNHRLRGIANEWKGIPCLSGCHPRSLYDDHGNG